MRAISTALIVALTKAQSSSSDGDSSGWGVNEPGPGDRGYRPSRGTVRIRTGLELACPRPGDAANSALDARTNFHALYDEMFSRIDHGGKISCMDVVCSVVPVSGNVVVLVDLAIASEVGEDEDGWKDHADRRLTAGDCWGANAHTAPGDRCYRPSCKVADPAEDNGWTTWNDRRLQGSDAAGGGLTEVCVEADDDGEGWTDHTDRRRRLDLDAKTPLGAEMEAFMWQMIEGRRLDGHTAVDAEEALAAYEIAAVEMAISGAMGDAFEDAFRGPPADVDKEVGPGDRGYDASRVFGDCSVDNRGTVRLIRQSEASVDEEEAGGGGGGGSKKKSSGSSDEIVIGVVVAIAFLLILCGVLYCAQGRGGGKSSRNSSSCASASAACASTPAEPVKLGPPEPEPDTSGMIRSYEMASTSSPRALEEGKEDVYASSTVRNPIKTPVV
mmetsp:Transcript_21604/g.64680  ORF Transcript_21604/g.64680 Transcript_21604/m.64680 type:complete len:442 (+) Transcript_21604:303-1628(+)